MKNLSPEERRLIDEAIAAGKITVVPQGKSGLEGMDFSWKAVNDRKAKASIAARARNGREKDPAVAARRGRIPELLESGMTAQQCADALGIKIGTFYFDLSFTGLKMPKGQRRNPRPEGTRDPLVVKKEARAKRGAEAVRDRRRFKTAMVAIGKPFKLAPADATGTIYTSKVSDLVPDASILKDGASNAKIGGDVLKGHLKGAHIVTLTLEERATCPRSCAVWRECYGNALHHSVRWRHGPELEQRIRDEVAALCATHDKVLVRLHVLGDFYSAAYVGLWSDLLHQYPGLNVFGFTAHAPDSDIGKAITTLRHAFGLRFAIRHSGRLGAWGSATIDFPTEQARIGDAIVCPEQRAGNAGEAGRHCGNCALCWHTDAAIIFTLH